MKDFNKEVETESFYVGKVNEGIVGHELVAYLYSHGFLNFKDGDNVLDVYSSKSSIYDIVPQDVDVKYYSLDNKQNIKFNDDDRVIELKTDNINKIDLEDDSIDFIFAAANRIGYGTNHSSIFEFERIIKKNGMLVVDMSKFWYQKQFNQFLFCSRNWSFERCVELNYEFDGNKTSKYFCYYAFKNA